MGFYLRKSISVGPFRFNLSKSGVGLSAGVRGFRVGTGPRGNYVHMGRGGLYYRATLSPASPRSRGIRQARLQQINVPQDELTAIESAETSTIVDSTSAELVKEINQKHRRFRLWPAVAVAGLVGLMLLSQNVALPGWGWMTLAGLVLAAAIAASVFDQMRKTTVVYFELDPAVETLFEGLHQAFDALRLSARCWHVGAEGRVSDRKRNAGASSVVRRTIVHVGKGNPAYVKTNVAVPSLPVGKQTLYFFPDKVLVFEPGAVGAVSYGHLLLDISRTRFVESGGVPGDAQVVDQTWQYVNKSGGPDRRFNNNRQMPVCLYEEIDFRSPTGLNERLQVSRTGAGELLTRAIQALAKVSEAAIAVDRSAATGRR